MIGQSDPEGAAFQYEYDANGRLSKTIDGNGNEIFREYGSDDTSSSGSACLTCENSPLEGGQGGVSERLQRIIYPTFTKEFMYDDEGRVSEEIYALNENETYSVTYTYDAFGRLQSTTGPDGQSTTYVYDRMGRRIRVEDPSGQTQFEYDNWDNLVALTDAKNQRTEFEYDTLGRLKKEIRPMLQETTYEYNEKGQLWKMVDAKNQMTEYGYDAQGRLETISYADGKTVTLSYDADNNLAGYSDGETSAEYNYDDLGRKTLERVHYGDFTKEFSYSYYKNGLKKTFTAPDGTMYEYSYGNNNELREVRIPGLGAVTIPDYIWNRPAKMVFPGGTQRVYGYDTLMRLQSLTVTDPGGNPLLDYAYTYDATGNIVTKATEHGNYAYDYDGSSRLTSVDNPVLDDETYTYDNVGNRLTAADVSGTWNYNANNELLGYADVEYDYDDNGNMTQITIAGSVVWTYVYDAANRLVHVEDGTGSISVDCYYDPFGRRLWKETGGERTYFFYSDEGLVGEYDASGNEIKTYGYKPDSTWMTDPLFLKQNGEYYFYQNDHLGTLQKLVGVNGAVVWSATYSAFGKAEVQVETVTNNLRFPGQYEDAETGLQYNWFRYYDPKIGRYLRVDPIGFAGGDVNLYGFGYNNPLKYIDSNGLQAPDWQVPVPDFDDLLQNEDYVHGILNRIRSQTAAFPLQLGHTEWWSGLINAFYNRNKDFLKNELKRMCPPPGSAEVRITPAMKSLSGKEQQCCHASCVKQIDTMVDLYMGMVQAVQFAELEQHGNIFGGWRGNLMRGYSDETGAVAGEGRECSEWSHIGEYAFFSSSAIVSFWDTGEACFRGATVNKGEGTLSFHQWVLIFGPSYAGPIITTQGPHVMVIDPWPSGGFEVAPKNHPYIPEQIDKDRYFWFNRKQFSEYKIEDPHAIPPGF